MQLNLVLNHFFNHTFFSLEPSSVYSYKLNIKSKTVKKMARRNRMNFSIFEKDLLQELYNKNKNDLSSGNKQLRKNVIDKIVLLFNGTPGIKAVSFY